MRERVCVFMVYKSVIMILGVKYFVGWNPLFPILSIIVLDLVVDIMSWILSWEDWACQLLGYPSSHWDTPSLVSVKWWLCLLEDDCYTRHSHTKGYHRHHFSWNVSFPLLSHLHFLLWDKPVLMLTSRCLLPAVTWEEMDWATSQMVLSRK